MVRGKNTKVWNEELERACAARLNSAISRRSAHEHMWREALRAVQGSRKEIYITGTGKVMGMPNIRQKRVNDVLQNVIRGIEPVLPAGHEHFDLAIPGYCPPQQQPEQHPLLRNMQYRGGSYAILLAFWQHSPQQPLTKQQILRFAQPYCDEAMAPNHWAGRDMSGWKSIETLERHQLVLRTSLRAQRAANGWRGCAPDQFVLSTTAAAFISAMLDKWPRTGGRADAAGGENFESMAAPSSQPPRAGRGGGGGGGRGDDNDAPRCFHGVAECEPYDAARGPCAMCEACAEETWDDGVGDWRAEAARRGVRLLRNGSAAATPSAPHPSHAFGGGAVGGRPSAATAGRGSRTSTSGAAAEDEAKLVAFVARASVGDSIEFKVSKERRLALHRACDRLELKRGVKLEHSSVDTGRRRTLIVRVDSTGAVSGFKRKAHGGHGPCTLGDLVGSEGEAAASLGFGVGVRAGAGGFGPGALLADVLPTRPLLTPTAAGQRLGGSGGCKLTAREQAARAAERRLQVSAQQAPAASTAAAPNGSAFGRSAHPVFHIDEDTGNVDVGGKTASIVIDDDDDDDEYEDGASRSDDHDGDEDLARALALSVEETRAAASGVGTNPPPSRSLRPHPDDKWSCAGCTLLNSSNALRCAACDAAREPPTRSKAAAGRCDDQAGRRVSARDERRGRCATAAASDVVVLSDDESPSTVASVAARPKSAGRAASNDPACIDESASSSGWSAAPAIATRVTTATAAAANAAAAATTTTTSGVAAAAAAVARTAECAVAMELLVDERERVNEKRPLGILLELHGILESLRSPPALSATRQKLSVGDFAWLRTDGGVDGEPYLLDLIVERKTVGDLVSRSRAGHHLEQLRRMGAVGLSRGLLLLENDIGTAAGFTAYGGAGAGAAQALRREEDVLEFLASLFGADFVAKALQTLSTTDTVRQLARLSCCLGRPRWANQRPVAAAGGGSLEALNKLGAKAAIEAARARLHRELLHAGAEAAAAERICLHFGSRKALRLALLRCPPSARRRLLCPLCSVDGAGCEGVAEGACCATSALCLRLMLPESVGCSTAANDTAATSTGASTIDLTVDVLPPSRSSVCASAAGGQRLLHLTSSPELSRLDAFRDFGLEAPTHHRWRIADGGSGQWVQLWAERDGARSLVFGAWLVSASRVIDAMRVVLAAHPSLSASLASADVTASVPLMDAAALVGAELLRGLEESPRGLRRPDRRMLVLVNLELVRKRAGRNEADWHLRDVAWPLAQATLLFLLVETEWHVHLAKNEAKAISFVQALARVCEREALLCCRADG